MCSVPVNSRLGTSYGGHQSYYRFTDKETEAQNHQLMRREHVCLRTMSPELLNSETQDIETLSILQRQQPSGGVCCLPRPPAVP